MYPVMNSTVTPHANITPAPAAMTDMKLVVPEALAEEPNAIVRANAITQLQNHFTR